MYKLEEWSAIQPDLTGAGWFICFAKEDTKIPAWRDFHPVKTWIKVYANGWYTRVEPIITTYTRHDFTTKKTISLAWKNKYEELEIECRSVINWDVTIHKWDELAMIYFV